MEAQTQEQPMSPPTPQDFKSAAETKLTGWEVYQMDHAQQVAWFAREVPRRVLEIMVEQDQPLQLVVHESLFDAVTEAVQSTQDVEIPPILLKEGGPTEQEWKDSLKEFCRKLPVRNAKLEEMLVPIELEIPPQEQFVIMLTAKGQQLNYLRQFDQRLGISQYLMENRIPLSLNQEDMLLMVKLFVLLQCINRAAQSQVQPAMAGQMQNLSGQIFKP